MSVLSELDELDEEQIVHYHTRQMQFEVIFQQKLVDSLNSARQEIIHQM